MKAYTAPKQPRALESESRFLNAFDELLRTQSYQRTTIDAIAQHAGLHKGAFLKRFGAKRAALIELFERYCIQASQAMQKGHEQLGRKVLLHDLCRSLSLTLEDLQRRHFSANRAMHKFFMEELVVATSPRI